MRNAKIFQQDKEKFLRVDQVVGRLGISRSTFRRGIQAGFFPPPVRISMGRAVGWPESQVDALIERIAEGNGGAA